MRQPKNDQNFVFSATPMLANRLQVAGDQVTGSITFKQWLVLLIVREMPVGSSVTEIARQHGSTRQNVMKLLRELSQQGYVQIKQAETDKRSYAVFMTPAGSATMKRISVPGNDFVRALFSGSSPSDIAVMRRVMTQMLCNLESLTSAPRKELS